ncbi:hypothetical protein FQN60_016176, partial [Etheostoma spectabile]
FHHKQLGQKWKRSINRDRRCGQIKSQKRNKSVYKVVGEPEIRRLASAGDGGRQVFTLKRERGGGAKQHSGLLRETNSFEVVLAAYSPGPGGSWLRLGLVVAGCSWAWCCTAKPIRQNLLFTQNQAKTLLTRRVDGWMKLARDAETDWQAGCFSSDVLSYFYLVGPDSHSEWRVAVTVGVDVEVTKTVCLSLHLTSSGFKKLR